MSLCELQNKCNADSIHLMIDQKQQEAEQSNLDMSAKYSFVTGKQAVTELDLPYIDVTDEGIS